MMPRRAASFPGGSFARILREERKSVLFDLARRAVDYRGRTGAYRIGLEEISRTACKKHSRSPKIRWPNLRTAIILEDEEWPLGLQLCPG